MELLPVSIKTIDALQRNSSSLQKQLEKKGEVKVSVSRDGNLEIDGESGNVWVAEQVIRALDYGFLPQHAFKLFNDNYFLEIIDLELVLPNEKAIERYKGRIIGAGGRAKATITELTGAFVAVHGNKVAVLGEFDDLQLAKEGILRLLEGSPHTGVYAYLEKKNRERKYNLK
ncbi:MAG TPA: KH domain-containing protein [Candidatus Norongarragalinales archaeon]|nr:KH domain-containing protein [Candidatus Norongarragalinales archaeon]